MRLRLSPQSNLSVSPAAWTVPKCFNEAAAFAAEQPWLNAST